MQIDNEILYTFIHCQYKAYKKSKQQKGVIPNILQSIKTNSKKEF